jgi:ParB family chromosome partitioning protein
MATKHGLGRGLGALLQDEPKAAAAAPAAAASAAAERAAGVQKVPIDQVHPSPLQPRRRFAPEALAELVASVRERGVLQPLLVRKAAGGYELIAGERRWRASKEAGIAEVPIVVLEASDTEALELALVENLQREDLNVIEEAEGYRVLADRFGLTQEQIAQRVGKARASVANALRLLGLPEAIRQYLSDGALSAGHAKVLLGVSIADEQRLYADRVVKQGLSVRELEKAVAHAQRGPRKKAEKHTSLPEDFLRDLSDKLHRHFGTSVRVVPCGTLGSGKKSKGWLEIDFYSNDELDRILSLLGLVERE